MFFIFSSPLPYTVNDGLACVRGRLIKTSIARSFFSRSILSITKDGEFEEAKRQIQAWLKDEPLLSLRVDCYYIWPKERLFTKGKDCKSPFRKIDGHNRNKPMHDVLSECLEIDDSFFFSGDTEKVFSEAAREPYALVKVSKHKPRSVHELMRDMK